MKIGIVGLGLIGGSIAKAYKKNSEAIVIGYDKDESVLDFAVMSGAVDEKLNDDNIKRKISAAKEAYLCKLILFIISVPLFMYNSSLLQTCCI